MEGIEITRLLEAVSQGDKAASERLFAVTYAHLKKIARHHINRSGGARTISPSTLVHEAYLKYSRHDGRAVSGEHFYNMLGQAMRQILLDIAKKYATEKHGAGGIRTELEDNFASDEVPLRTLLDIDAALKKLEQCDPELARVVEWHFFAGLSFEHIAEAIGVNHRTVRRQWNAARSFMLDVLDSNRPS